MEDSGWWVIVAWYAIGCLVFIPQAKHWRASEVVGVDDSRIPRKDGAPIDSFHAARMDGRSEVEFYEVKRKVITTYEYERVGS